MSRLIDADTLKRYIPTQMDMQDLYLPVHFETLIDEQPTIDAVEVVHGDWKKGIHQAECSACCEKFYFGDDIWLEDYDICDDIGWKYCPNCGARMDGKEKSDG